MNICKLACRQAACGLMLAIVVAMTFLSPKSLTAQQFFGSVVGTVTDTSGAIIPGATITLSNKATGEKHAATSNGAGEYQFVDLVPATYSVDVAAANFKHFLSNAIQVDVNQTVRVNAALQVGAATETVEVNMAATVELQTDSGTVSNKVEKQQMDELPLNGRNVMQLLTITAGVMDTSAVESGATSAQNGGTSSNPKSFGGGANLYIINGGDNEEYLDGAPINMLQGSNVAIVPTGDDVQEFAVDTSASDSSEGRATGGVINFTTKSGSNQIHGTMYDYFRNTDLNANNFFSNQQGLARGVFNQNQYGFNLGVPVKKDKIFFFGSYEVADITTSTPITASVPTAAMMSGQFTRSIVDPESGKTLSASGIADSCIITQNTVQGTWSLNQGVYGTPGGCIDPTSAILKTFWATAPNQNSTTANFATNVPGGSTSPQMNARMDWNISPNQRLFAHTAWWAPLDKPLTLFPNPNVPSALPGGAPWNLGMQVGGLNTNLYIVGDTYTFNPKTVMDLRAEWVRFRFSKIAKVNNFNLGNLGGGSVTGTNNWAPLQQYNPAGAQYLPGPTFSSSVGGLAHNLLPNTGLGAPVFTSAVAGTFGTTGSGQQWDNYGLNGTLTRVFGKHSVKFGFEARLMDMAVLPAGNPANPSFGVNYSCTYSGSTCASGTGDEWAELLMGYFVNTTFGATYGGTEFNYYQAYFVSDSWQVTPKLTLNVGLRYELPGSLYEKKNHTLVFQPFTTDPTTGAYGTEALVASAQSPSRATTAVKHLDFDPRIGIAYRLDSKTVVRGGFGLTQMAVDLDGGGNGAPGSSVNNSTLGWKNPTGAGQLPTTTLQDPITASAVFVPPMFHTNPAFLQVLAQANQTAGGVALAGNYLNERLPYFEEYNFAVQHQIGNSFQITAAYVGSHGLELNAGGSIDEIVGPGNSYHLAPQYTVAGTGSAEVATSTVAVPGAAAGTNLTATLNNTQTIYTPNGHGQLIASPNQKGVLCTSGYTAPPAGATSFNGFCNANVKVGAALQPYPNYTGATISNLAYGNQHYNGFQVTTTWRIPGGGLIGSALTFAKTIGDNVNYQDYYNHRADRTVQGVPSRLAINFNYPLPIGQGQKFLNVGGPVSYLISGWAINDVSSFQHGSYLGITSNTKTSIPGAGTTRATYVPGCNKVVSGSAVSRLSRWFNTSCFAGVNQNVGGTVYMGPYDWGNENAQDPKLFAQGIDNSDISLAKTTKVAEKFSVIFRMETFNTFNRFEAAAPTSLAAGNALFGVVQAQANNPRQVQLSLRVTY